MVDLVLWIVFRLQRLWSIGLIVGLIIVWQKVMPIVTEAKTQVRRVTDQAKSVAAKVSNTADIVHAQTQNLIGNASSAGNQVTRQARTVGAALTGILVAARVINFVRKVM